MKTKVYLFCNSGMSTSLLAGKIQNAADIKGLDMEVKAFSYLEIEDIVKEYNPNCILLGPQIKYKINEVKSQFKDMNIAIDVINQMHYGMMDGQKVLESVINIMK